MRLYSIATAALACLSLISSPAARAKSSTSGTTTAVASTGVTPGFSQDATALPTIDASTSLLVISPHPDDETLCCAGAIQRVLAAGGHASVVWITSGDGSELDLLVVEKSLFLEPAKLRDLARKRMQEARKATATLGVPASQQFFLGYPDRGVLSLINDNFATPYRSRFTAAASVPYEDSVSPGHPYTGENLEQDLETVLRHVKPTLVLAPSPQDTHPDHRASGILAMRVLARTHSLSTLRYWIVHGGEGWPTPRGLYRGIPLQIPARGRGLPLLPFALTDAEESRKLDAIHAYKTQMEIMSSFLLAFVRTNELYSAIPVPSPTRNSTPTTQ